MSTLAEINRQLGNAVTGPFNGPLAGLAGFCMWVIAWAAYDIMQRHFLGYPRVNDTKIVLVLRGVLGLTLPVLVALSACAAVLLLPY